MPPRSVVVLKAIAGLAIALPIVLIVAAPGQPAAAREGMWSTATVRVDIPAQPLERALVAYSTATGIQLLYDTGLVAGQRSNPVRGRYPPQQALEILLRGTGLRVRYASPGAITLAAVKDRPRELLVLDTMKVEAAPIVLRDSRRFSAYGERLQNGIMGALRRDPVAGRGRYEVTLRVWMDLNGTVSRCEIGESNAPAETRAAILSAVRNLEIGGKPPEDMPQPIAFRFRAQPPG